ncbi:MAG: FMN-binding protein [Candidatus Omnitrophica bacterium]|nr:FMN-binding protein [Candidatus Omnitrophota bacterium]
MNDTLKITGTLTVTCLLCAFLLAYVAGIAKPKIAAHQTRERRAAIQTLIPNAETIRPYPQRENLFRIYDASDTLLGYAFLAEGQGYAGTIRLVGALDADLSRLRGIKVIESVETPGLGSKITEEDFRGQFENLKVRPKIGLTKGETSKDTQVQAISGATISSKAVVSILNEKISLIKAVIESNRNH